MAFYNISINKVGIVMLQDQKALLNRVSQYIMNDYTPELKIMSLRLLQSMTINIISAQVYRELLAVVSRFIGSTFYATIHYKLLQ